MAKNMKVEKVVICGNPDCEAELRIASVNDYIGGIYNRISQEYCPHCKYTSIPKVKE